MTQAIPSPHVHSTVTTQGRKRLLFMADSAIVLDESAGPTTLTYTKYIYGRDPRVGFRDYVRASG